MSVAVSLAELSARLEAHGLLLRSGFNFDAAEVAPAKSVLLVGNAGAGYWSHFQAWLGRQSPPLDNPLDSWSRSVIGDIAKSVGARAVSPSDKPYWPFQQWAMRAERLKPSPLGILMHPEYGLWHAYRGALLFDQPMDLPVRALPLHLCELCSEKPCLHACPVNAYSADGFEYDACLTYVRGEAASMQTSEASCRTAGCRDRNACPVGTAFRYPPAVQAFHMAAFAKV